MKYYDNFEEEDKKLYSINFQLAEFEEINNLKRDIKIIDNHVRCSYFNTKDFKTRSYYKHISTCVKIFKIND